MFPVQANLRSAQALESDVGFELTIPAPDPANKRRHIWIVAAPDWGKTRWIQNTFAGLSVFVRIDAPYPYEDYDGEPIVIFDDLLPKFEEIVFLSNTYKTSVRIPGGSRFITRYWPMNHTVTIIVLSNLMPAYGNHDAGVAARFNVYNLK